MNARVSPGAHMQERRGLGLESPGFYSCGRLEVLPVQPRDRMVAPLLGILAVAQLRMGHCKEEPLQGGAPLDPLPAPLTSPAPQR